MSARSVSRPKLRTRYSYSTIATLCVRASTVSTVSVDPRAALERLVLALERHLEASSARRGEDDPHVIAAYEDLADAFEDYDGALYEAYGEMTPLDIYTGDDEDDDDEDGDGQDLDDDEDGDDERLYAGLDDVDLDDEDDEDDVENGDGGR